MSPQQSFEQELDGADEVLPFDADADDLVSAAVLGPGAFLYIGQGLTADEFTDYVRDYNFGSIPPDFIVLHHTAIPSTQAARYPKGGVWDLGETRLNAAQI